MSAIRVLLVDDHAIVRAGLRAILDPLPNIQVVAEAADAPAAMSQLFRCTIDLVLLDIGLPGRSGVELLKQIKASWPKLPVLILSNYPEDQYAVRVFKQGAAGYLTKETAPERLAEAIRRVAQGGRFITETVADRLIDSVAGDSERAPHESLSDREFEVFKQIAAGRSLTEIADTHNVSVKTVSTQRARILEKTGLATNADITRYALAHRLVE
jgi:DNA-binding NarL/FixJ family response regulator